MGQILLYGAYGYTGRLVTARAAARGLTPILAGRDAGKLADLTARHGNLPVRAFGLGDIGGNLQDVTTLVNLAGPFSRTAEPLARACMAAGIHYVDITGEIAVFETLHAYGEAAAAAGTVLLPGAGFDVVPSDCLAAHVHRRMPDAVSLEIVIGGLTDLSRGTARTALESIDAGTKARRGGQVVTLPGTPRGTADLGRGLRPTVQMSWGDVATAFWSTGIPDIDVYFEANERLERVMRLPAALRWFLGTPPGRALANRAIDRQPAGPDEHMRASGRAVILAEATDAEGNRAISELETPEAYRLTAMTALETALRVDRGEASPGFHTPSTAFGPDFVMSFPGVSRSDV